MNEVRLDTVLVIVDQGVIRPVRWFHPGIDSDGQYCDPEDVCRSCERIGQGVICDQCDDDDRLDTGSSP